MALVIDGFFSREECAALIEKCERAGWHQATINVGNGEEELDLEERNHLRCFVDDALIAREISERIKQRVGITHDFCNPRVRVLKYSEGNYFKPHYDGEQEWLGGASTHTVLVYLTDSAPEDGGYTRFCDSGVRIQPRIGRAVVFLQENNLHEGETVLRGTKMVARTDLMRIRSVE